MANGGEKMSTMTSVAETTQNWAGQRQLRSVFSQQTGSTNDDAKKKARGEGEDLVLYVTAHQTAGRGRGTNVWLDTGNGEGLLSTWSLHVESAPQAITAPRIGLALFNAVNTVWPSLEWGLKAPNDLYLNGHKVGGLLVESVTGGDAHRLLVGLGMNILNHPRRFNEADHLSKTLHSVPDEGEWFQFLDELRGELAAAVPDILRATLSAASCIALAGALNSNSSRAFTVKSVSPAGDLIHAGGTVPWTNL
jgi:BirA family transcriptional regulator, biotin operon repressor / biotin---[acetyl-CoA-carboxylase] ligase